MTANATLCRHFFNKCGMRNKGLIMAKKMVLFFAFALGVSLAGIKQAEARLKVSITLSNNIVYLPVTGANPIQVCFSPIPAGSWVSFYLPQQGVFNVQQTPRNFTPDDVLDLSQNASGTTTCGMLFDRPMNLDIAPGTYRLPTQIYDNTPGVEAYQPGPIIKITFI